MDLEESLIPLPMGGWHIELGFRMARLLLLKKSKFLMIKTTMCSLVKFGSLRVCIIATLLLLGVSRVDLRGKIFSLLFSGMELVFIAVLVYLCSGLEGISYFFLQIIVRN